MYLERLIQSSSPGTVSRAAHCTTREQTTILARRRFPWKVLAYIHDQREVELQKYHQRLKAILDPMAGRRRALIPTLR